MDKKLVKEEDAKIQKNETDKKEKKSRKKKKKKQFTIFGYDMWRITQYFIIYSIVGCIIETLYGLLTKGVIESRRSSLYTPVCCIYGLGAVIMILGLQYFRKNNYSLFLGGFIIGAIVEYVISLVGEFIFHIKYPDEQGVLLFQIMINFYLGCVCGICLGTLFGYEKGNFFLPATGFIGFILVFSKINSFMKPFSVKEANDEIKNPGYSLLLKKEFYGSLIYGAIGRFSKILSQKVRCSCLQSFSILHHCFNTICIDSSGKFFVLRLTPHQNRHSQSIFT